MSIESFDKLLVLVRPRITYENTRLRPVCESKLVVSQNTYSYIIKIVPPFPF